MGLIQELEAEAIAAFNAAKDIPEFRPGDTVRVGVRVVEGERTRVQNYEGVCIARSNRGISSNFTVRKMSFGEGVERVFPLYSPNVESIEVVRRGVVRRAKLYYLRGRTGKRARIAERKQTASQPRKAERLPRNAISCGNETGRPASAGAPFSLSGSLRHCHAILSASPARQRACTVRAVPAIRVRRKTGARRASASAQAAPAS